MALNLGLRPRLTFDVPGDAVALGQKIRGAASHYSIVVAGSYLVIKIAEKDQHYWSPQLQVTLEEEEGTVHVNGLFTPMPAVWTMFVGLYSLFAVMGFFGSIYGFAQRSLGQSSIAVWALPLSILLICCVYGAALIGQRMGHTQTEELSEFLHQCVDPQESENEA